MTKTKPYIKTLKIIIIAIFLGLISLGIFFIINKQDESISLEKFNELINTKISNAYIYEDTLYFNANNKNYSILANDEIIKKVLEKTHIDKKIDFDYSIPLLIIMIIIFLYYVYYIRSLEQKSKQGINQHPINNLLKPEFKFVIKTDDNFNDVIGQNKAKKELKKLSAIFNNNISIKGVLLTGASGVGKTMLARALATECGVNFLYQSASSFNEIFVGLGARRVRELFANARKIAPCIVFIDEIDALGKQRGNSLASDSENTLNELLTQIDGFNELKNVLIIAATNRADTLDDALLRRFDKVIHFTLPNYSDRCEFLNKLVSKNLISKNENINYLAKISHGFSGSSFKTLENELLLDKNINITKQILSQKHGINEDLELNDSEKQAQAIYQAGKIIMAKICDAKLIYANLFYFEYYFENEHIKTFSQIKNEIKILLSGVLANELILEETYNNFKEDNNKIEKLLDFYIKVDLDELQNECKEFLQAYQDDIKQIASDLLHNNEIFF